MRSQDWGALVSSKLDFPVTTFSLILLPYIYLMSLKLACWCNLLGIEPLHLSQNLLSAPVAEDRGLTSNPGTICWIIWIKYLVITNYFTYYVILFFLHTSPNIWNSRYNCVAFAYYRGRGIWLPSKGNFLLIPEISICSYWTLKQWRFIFISFIFPKKDTKLYSFLTTKRGGWN